MIISLGATCSVAWQLKEHKLRDFSLPFDWVRINNLSHVNTLLETNFEDFFNSFELVSKSDKFLVNGDNISYIYKNKFCKFYHDFKEEINENTFNEFKIKYSRRINRLYDIINNNNELLFIREEVGIINKNKIDEFNNIIKKLNPNLKWKLVIITSNQKYEELKKDNIKIVLTKGRVVNWQRPELDWSSIFSF